MEGVVEWLVMPRTGCDRIVGRILKRHYGGAVSLHAWCDAIGQVAGDFIVGVLIVCLNCRVEISLLSINVFLRLLQCRFCLLDCRVGAERLFDERIERRALERCPPVKWHVSPLDEMLNVTAIDRRRCG